VSVLLMAVLFTAGCTSQKSEVSKPKYVSFLMSKFTAITSSMETVKKNISNFSEASLSDTHWVDSMNTEISKAKAVCDEIINYTGAPADFTNLHTKLVEMANQVKPALESYEQGIKNKDFAMLSAANEQLNKAMGSVDQYLSQLKSEIEGLSQ
ncbi:MAG: DUF6376 family protein, partial [Eubacterium sp.]